MPTTVKRWAIVAVLAAALSASLWIWRAGPVDAPAVELVTIEGEKLSVAALRGKVVLVKFWATDCAACVKEIPALSDTYRRYHSRGFETLFVAMPYDRPDHVLHFARTRALPFKVALDIRGEINRSFGGVDLTPTAFVIDKRGRIVERIVGVPDVTRLDRLIERSLGEPS